MKIQNRFKKDRFMTVHDQFVLDLYKLNTALPRFTLREKIINGEKYLINSFVEKNKYEVGIAVKIPRELISIGVNLDRFTHPVEDEYSRFYESMKERLQFSEAEILVTNILFSKYLSEYYAINQISFKDIERYRSKSSSKRNIVLNEDTFKRYKHIIDSLCAKTIYLKTGDVRHPTFGVNNRNIMQPFLVVTSRCMTGVTNMQFNYSFGNFGKFIKRSRRYSNNLPNIAYSYNFKQAKKHCTAIYVAQEVFWQNYRIKKRAKKFAPPGEFDFIIEVMPICEWVYGRYNITTKEYRLVLGYIEDVLKMLQATGEIGEYVVSEKITRKKHTTFNVKTTLQKLYANGLNEDAKLLLGSAHYENDLGVDCTPSSISSMIVLNLGQHKVETENT